MNMGLGMNETRYGLLVAPEKTISGVDAPA
jgi:hypothetical protein